MQVDSDLASYWSDFVDGVISEVDHTSQCAQNQSVNIIIEVDFFTVVLDRKDAVHRDPYCCTELFHLSVKETFQFINQHEVWTSRNL